MLINSINAGNGSSNTVKDNDSNNNNNDHSQKSYFKRAKRSDRSLLSQRCVQTHLKYAQLLNNDYSAESFTKLIRYLYIERHPPLRWSYIEKILYTLLSELPKQGIEIDASLKKGIDTSVIKSNLLIDVKNLSNDKKEQILLLNERRNLVFSDNERKSMFRECLNRLDILSKKSTLDKRDIHNLEFYILFILSHITGARTMASLKQLTRQQYIRLIETGHVQTIGKHCSLTTIFMVDQIRHNCKHLFELLLGQLGGSSEGNRVFNTSVRQLNYRLENLYKNLFKRAKAKHLGWHASRRWFIGELYSTHGPKIASHSVSHHDIKTTMQYVQKSKHLDDIKFKINESVANKLF